MWFFLDILYVHKFLYYHIYLYYYIFCPVHHVVQVKIFHVHAHVPCFDVRDGAVNMEFRGGQVWCWCSYIYWIIYNIFSWSESCPMSICFLRSDIADLSHVGFLSVLWFILVKDELYCVCYLIFFHPWNRRPSFLHIVFVHTGASILNRSLYHNNFQLFCNWCGLLVVPLWLYLFWCPCEQGSLCLCVLSFFCRAHFKHIRCSCHMVDSIGSWPGIILI